MARLPLSPAPAEDVLANLRAIHSVGSSLVAYLRNAYARDENPLRNEQQCEFHLVSSSEINAQAADFSPAVTLYLYRVTMNPHLRNCLRVNELQQTFEPLSLDLHYMLTVWGATALTEHSLLGWVVRELYMHQTLGASDLNPDASWRRDDCVQVIPSELTNEDLMRIWDALEPPYRLSVSYIARVVQIDPDLQPDALPVVARRFRFVNPEAAG